jgi:hypothetical protein
MLPFSWQVATARGGPLDFAKLLRKTLQVAEVEMLIGEAQNAMPPERQQDPAHVTKHRAGRFGVQHPSLPFQRCGSTMTVPILPPASTALCAAAVS